MTDTPSLPALREAVAETVSYCGQGETVPNAWARRERAELILLDAVPALLDEVEAARKVLETAIELPGYCAYAVIGVDAAAWQAWQARRKP